MLSHSKVASIRVGVYMLHTKYGVLSATAYRSTNRPYVVPADSAVLVRSCCARTQTPRVGSMLGDAAEYVRRLSLTVTATPTRNTFVYISSHIKDAEAPPVTLWGYLGRQNGL